jgi:ABC-type nitrate/sulfonate/bicarbonate transport system substrate-binding protein
MKYKPSKPHGAALPDTIWYTRCPVPTAAGLAIQKGLLEEVFASDGIKFRSVRHSQDPKIRESHYTHTLDNSFRQGGNAPAIYARSEGRDTILLGLHFTPQYQAILSLPEVGIKTISDLRGRRLALPRRMNDAIDYWRAIVLQAYQNILRLADLNLSDVELIDLPNAQPYIDEDVAITDSLTPASRTVKLQTLEMTALLKGEVDAMLGYSVWGAELRGQLSAVEIFPFSGLPLEAQINNEAPQTLTVSGGLLRDHPELVERYLMKALAASEWAKQNRSAAITALAVETGSAEYWVDKGCGSDVANSLDFSLNESLVKALEVRKNFLLEHGFLRHDFSVRGWIDPRPLQNAIRRLQLQRAAASLETRFIL